MIKYRIRARRRRQTQRPVHIHGLAALRRWTARNGSRLQVWVGRKPYLVQARMRLRIAVLLHPLTKQWVPWQLPTRTIRQRASNRTAKAGDTTQEADCNVNLDTSKDAT